MTEMTKKIAMLESENQRLCDELSAHELTANDFYRAVLYHLKQETGEGVEFGVSRTQRVLRLDFGSTSRILDEMTRRGDLVAVDGFPYKRQFPVQSADAAVHDRIKKIDSAIANGKG